MTKTQRISNVSLEMYDILKNLGCIQGHDLVRRVEAVVEYVDQEEFLASAGRPILPPPQKQTANASA